MKDKAIRRFLDGGKVRLTCGIWNNPTKDGRFAKSVEDIESFFSWANKVDEKQIEDGILDLVGASYCDMF